MFKIYKKGVLKCLCRYTRTSIPLFFIILSFQWSSIIHFVFQPLGGNGKPHWCYQLLKEVLCWALFWSPLIPRKYIICCCDHMQTISQFKISSVPLLKSKCAFKRSEKSMAEFSENFYLCSLKVENMSFIILSWFIQADWGCQCSHEQADVYYPSSALRDTGGAAGVTIYW